MTWQSQTPIVAILLAYLGFLFLVAAVAERFGRRLAKHNIWEEGAIEATRGRV